MKRLVIWVAIVGLFTGGCESFSGFGSSDGSKPMPVEHWQKARITQSMDADWRFLKSDAQGAEAVAFDDSSWRKLDVPHDWSIEGPFDQAAPARGAGATLPQGTGWYRKHFNLPADYAQRRVFIQFDGVMANSDVWINGQNLGHRPYGYSSFEYEMTGKLNFGDTPNVLAVKADNSQQPASRWYAGDGIYRHVRLVATDPVHVEHWATFVTTPTVKPEQATVHVQTSVVNQSDAARDVSLQIDLIDSSGKTTKAQAQAQNIAAGKSAEFNQDITVTKPELWNPDSPKLYHAVVHVNSGGKSVDDDAVTFGVRTIAFKHETGFWINGKNMKLLGVCLHADGGAVGAAVPLGVWRRRFENLREMGVNAIRTAHNPPAPEFLDLCDQMGFLVMDESFDCWTVAKNPYDYHLYFNDWSLIDIKDYVMRDRNHPSIVMYSSGNEIHDTPKEELAKTILRGLVDQFHKYDPTRPVTQALFRPNVSNDYTNGLADMLDVIGTNYRDNELLEAWKANPKRTIVGTEQQMGRDTWLYLRDNPQHSGQFLWAGIDYMGEAFWPNVNSQQGLLDRTGELKPLGLERQAWWSTKPVVNIVRSPEPGGARGGFGAAAPAQRQGEGAAQPDPAARGRGGRGGRGGGGAARGRGAGPGANWTLREPTTQPVQVTVTVNSNCTNVELFLNDKSLGTKDKAADDAPRTWTIAFEPGVLKAIGKNDGKVVATDELRTAGKPAKIMLVADQSKLSPTFDDVSFVTAKVVDDKGVVCPFADDLITFNLSGPGFVAAVDNADSADHDSFQTNQRKAFNGRVLAIIKANAPSGQIKIEATAKDLAGSSVTIQATR